MEHWLVVAGQPGKALDGVRKAIFPHLSNKTVAMLIGQAVVCLALFAIVLPRILREFSGWQDLVLCSMLVTGWYSAILTLRNHAIGFVMEGALICLVSTGLLVAYGIALMELEAELPGMFAVLVLALWLLSKGYRCLRRGWDGMRSSATSILGSGLGKSAE